MQPLVNARRLRRLIDLEEGRQDHRRRNLVIQQTLGEEAVVAVRATEEELAGDAAQVSAEIELITLQPVTLAEIADRAPFGLETRQPPVGAQPQPPGRVRLHALNPLLAQ